MIKLDKCPYCGEGHYSYGSALYDYYSCGHQYVKPLPNEAAPKLDVLFFEVRFNGYNFVVLARPNEVVIGNMESCKGQTAQAISEYRNALTDLAEYMQNLDLKRINGELR